MMRFNNVILIGQQIHIPAYVNSIQRIKCNINPILKWIREPWRHLGNAYVLNGVEHTGKKTLMYQIINEMTKEERDKTAFVYITSNDYENLYQDMRQLSNYSSEEDKVKYVFIYDATVIKKLDIYLESLTEFTGGFKFIFAGQNPFVFCQADHNGWYDMHYTLDMNYLSFKDYMRLTNLEVNNSEKQCQYINDYFEKGSLPYLFKHILNHEQYLNKLVLNIQEDLQIEDKWSRKTEIRHLYDLALYGELSHKMIQNIENISYERFNKCIEDNQEKIHKELYDKVLQIKSPYHQLELYEYQEIERILMDMGLLKVWLYQLNPTKKNRYLMIPWIPYQIVKHFLKSQRSLDDNEIQYLIEMFQQALLEDQKFIEKHTYKSHDDNIENHWTYYFRDWISPDEYTSFIQDNYQKIIENPFKCLNPDIMKDIEKWFYDTNTIFHDKYYELNEGIVIHSRFASITDVNYTKEGMDIGLSYVATAKFDFCDIHIKKNTVEWFELKDASKNSHIEVLFSKLPADEEEKMIGFIYHGSILAKMMMFACLKEKEIKENGENKNDQ